MEEEAGDREEEAQLVCLEIVVDRYLLAFSWHMFDRFQSLGLC